MVEVVEKPEKMMRISEIKTLLSITMQPDPQPYPVEFLSRMNEEGDGNDRRVEGSKVEEGLNAAAALGSELL